MPERKGERTRDKLTKGNPFHCPPPPRLAAQEVDAQLYSCGKTIESRTHIAGECEMYNEKRGVLEGDMRATDEGDMEGVWYTR